MEGVTLVAKAKSSNPDKRALIGMRCDPAFKAWLEKFAEHERSTPTQLLELGLVEMAKLRKYKAPPKR